MNNQGQGGHRRRCRPAQRQPRQQPGRHRQRQGAAEIRTGSLNNSQKGGIGSSAGLALVADLVDNSQNGRITAKGAIDANLKGLDQQGSGRLVSDTAIALDLRGENWSTVLRA